jgi:hypothetical protein
MFHLQGWKISGALLATCLVLASWFAYSSTLKMENKSSPETSANLQRTTKRYIQGDKTLVTIVVSTSNPTGHWFSENLPLFYRSVNQKTLAMLPATFLVTHGKIFSRSTARSSLKIYIGDWSLWQSFLFTFSYNLTTVFQKKTNYIAFKTLFKWLKVWHQSLSVLACEAKVPTTQTTRCLQITLEIFRDYETILGLKEDDR